jgi:RNA polymerase sigma-70 factor (ECF subfamily)
MMKKEEELYIIEQVKKGDSSLFPRLVECHSPRILSIVRGVVGNKEDAEEVAQDVFVKAFFSLSGFRFESSFSTWLFKIAYNMSVSKVRIKKRDVSSFYDVASVEDSTVAESEDKGRKEEMFRALYSAIDQLDTNDRFVLLSFYNHQKSIKEISQITGMSESNVKVRLHRIKKRLAVMLDNNKLCYG